MAEGNPPLLGFAPLVAGIAVAGLADLVAGKFERGEAGLFADVLGGDLIDGDAGVNVAAGG
jgi:hypothetical protein